MDIINWKNEYSVGIAEMDNQHKKLLAMINRLIEEQKVLTDPVTIAELLTEMTDYALEHFRAEEYLMAENNYPFKAKQEEQHKSFIQETQEFMNATTNIGPNILSNALLDYLGSWMVKHILQEDMQYKEFFKSKGIH